MRWLCFPFHAFAQNRLKLYRVWLVSAMVGGLLFAAGAGAWCANVNVQTGPGQPLRLKPHARITVLFDGQPLRSAQIDLWPSDSWGRPAGNTTSLTTDGEGVVTLPELTSSRYFIGSQQGWPSMSAENVFVCVIPCQDDGLETADLVPEGLDGGYKPVNRDESALSEIRIEIGPERDPQWPRLLSEGEQQEASNVLPELRGVVQDVTGAIIPDALIDIVVKGTEGKNHAALLHADHVGRFSARLPTGDYVAIIAASGFASRSVPFSIAATPTATELQVVLQVASETITIAVTR